MSRLHWPHRLPKPDFVDTIHQVEQDSENFKQIQSAKRFFAHLLVALLGVDVLGALSLLVRSRTVTVPGVVESFMLVLGIIVFLFVILTAILYTVELVKYGLNETGEAIEEQVADGSRSD
jgi:hypothetical protein